MLRLSVLLSAIYWALSVPMFWRYAFGDSRWRWY